MRRLIQSLAAAFIGLSVASVGAVAQEWKPDRPVRLIVPFGPGGATDVVARIIGNSLSPLLGQPVIIENRPGAGATVATNAVKDSPPDGHTLLMATIGFGANPALFREKLPYDVVKDFTHVTKLVIVPTILVVHPSVGVKTAEELLAKAKEKPGTLTFGSAGFGTVNHLAGEMLKASTGVNLTHVPYRSGGQSSNGVLTGEISMLFATAPTSLQHIEKGTIVALATGGKKALPQLPKVPALAATVPGFDVVEWQGVIGPPGMPRNILDALNAKIVAVLKDPAVVKRLEEIGAEPDPSTPEEFRDFVIAEVKRWYEVSDKTGMRVE